jgi:hypothetical protein
MNVVTVWMWYVYRCRRSVTAMLGVCSSQATSLSGYAQLYNSLVESIIILGPTVVVLFHL